MVPRKYVSFQDPAQYQQLHFIKYTSGHILFYKILSKIIFSRIQDDYLDNRA